jgi:hypothetical protein
MLPRSNWIKGGKRGTRSHALLIDRRAKHNLLSFEAGMTNTDNSVAVYASEHHIIQEQLKKKERFS